MIKLILVLVSMIRMLPLGTRIAPNVYKIATAALGIVKTMTGYGFVRTGT